jgi:hypothetical protein
MPGRGWSGVHATKRAGARSDRMANENGSKLFLKNAVRLRHKQTHAKHANDSLTFALFWNADQHSER